MKLNKDTRELIKIGITLKQSNNVTYTVTSMYKAGKAIYITTISNQNKAVHYYGMPISNFYGLEIL